MASSSSSSRKYEVFVSFRGEDTRNGFTSHLAAALRRKQIDFFIDDEELNKGDEISPSLLNAIETADLSIIIFSKDYASSKWCLNELVKILDCKNVNEQIVIPVFYHVDPSDVRNQKRSFGESFVVHENNFKEMPEKVHKWRAALTEAADLSGYGCTKSRNEAELVEEIVADISKKLEDMSDSTDLDGFVGLNSQIEKIKRMLCLEMLDVRVIGIWGMGGIGKTTLASVVFHQISRKFQGKCFMSNLREETNKMGVKQVRDEVICQVLGESLKIGTPIIPPDIKKRLQRMKVLIVLDDVHSEFTQLESLVGGLDQFSPGSRIIITTRDKKVLDKCGVNNVYKVKGLKHNQALELFCRKAFRQNNCSPDLLYLSEQVVCYANGNPLALEVLGASFYQKSKQQWEDKLRLKLTSEPDIYEVLKISYDELNAEEKKIFLDIAGCGITRMSVVCYILKKIRGPISIKLKLKKALKLKCIDLSDSQCLKRMWDPSETPNLERTILANCTKLACFPSSVQNFNHLSYLCFRDCKSLRSFPNNLHFDCEVSVDFSYCDDLIEFPKISGKITKLDLSYSAIEEGPSSIQNFNHLHNLRFEGCKSLRSFPNNLHFDCEAIVDFSLCDNLIEFPNIYGKMTGLDFSYSAIEEVPSSMECLTYLEELNMSSCTRLKRLSSRIYDLKSLTFIGEFLNLESLPEILEKTEHLEHISITELLSSDTELF